MQALSLGAARFTMSARMRRPSGSSSICSRSPERTECDSANAFQPCSVYSNLLLFLRGSACPHLATARRQSSAPHPSCPLSSLIQECVVQLVTLPCQPKASASIADDFCGMKQFGALIWGKRKYIQCLTYVGGGFSGPARFSHAARHHTAGLAVKCFIAREAMREDRA